MHQSGFLFTKGNKHFSIPDRCGFTAFHRDRKKDIMGYIGGMLRMNRTQKKKLIAALGIRAYEKKSVKNHSTVVE